MATTNFDRVGRALELLRTGLGPFVEREVKSAIATQALSAERVRGFVEDPMLANKAITDWDASALLKLMWDIWNEVFRRTLGLPSAAWCQKCATGATSGRTNSRSRATMPTVRWIRRLGCWWLYQHRRLMKLKR